MDDGSVAVFGGVNGSGFVTSSERYLGGTWTSLGNPGIQGNVFEAVTLGTGQSLVRSDGSHIGCFQSSFCIRATSSAPLVARRPVRASVKNSDLQNGL